jgi:hypothetical protein
MVQRYSTPTVVCTYITYIELEHVAGGIRRRHVWKEK